MNVYDFVGVIGALIIAGFYFYAQYRFTFLNTYVFFVGNIIGSLLIISSLLLSSFNLPSFLIETLWIAVSFFGIYKYHVVREGTMEDLTYRQNELSIDGFTTEVTKREFTKLDLGVAILFKQVDGSMLPERSMDMRTFLFNGTTMLTPAAISESTLNINTLENQWRINKNCYFVGLDENKTHGVAEMKNLFKKYGVIKDRLIVRHENKPVLFFVTGFMNKIEGMIGDDGVVHDEIFKVRRCGISLAGAEYISNLDIFGAIIIDSISFEPTGVDAVPGFLSTTELMNVDRGKKTFTPLIYHAKTPSSENKYDSCSIRIGNVPSGIIPGFPVSIKVK